MTHNFIAGRCPCGMTLAAFEANMTLDNVCPRKEEKTLEDLRAGKLESGRFLPEGMTMEYTVDVVALLARLSREERASIMTGIAGRFCTRCARERQQGIICRCQAITAASVSPGSAGGIASSGGGAGKASALRTNVSSGGYAIGSGYSGGGPRP